MKSGLRALIWCMLCLVAWGAVVPDASVVEPQDGAPRLPNAGEVSVKHNGHPGQVPSAERPQATPAAASQGSGSASAPAQVAVPTSGGAFADQNSTDPASTGESRPLEPLAPAPVSTGSATPLWAALILFLFLAVGGFWLAQKRDPE